MRWLRCFGVASVLGTALFTFPRASPASVEEQRARLPPAAKCGNEIEGTWLGLRWSSHRRPPQWYKVTLEVRFASSERPQDLTGQMIVRFWNGGEQTTEPPPTCGRNEGLVVQPSKGTFAKGEIDFLGLSWKSDAPGCTYNGLYYLDHYSGRIDPQLHEFQAVNNDGGLAVNEPTVFRRIKCLEEAAPAAIPVKVSPPSFTPRRRWGCGNR